MLLAFVRDYQKRNVTLYKCPYSGLGARVKFRVTLLPAFTVTSCSWLKKPDLDATTVCKPAATLQTTLFKQERIFKCLIKFAEIQVWQDCLS